MRQLVLAIDKEAIAKEQVVLAIAKAGLAM